MQTTTTTTTRSNRNNAHPSVKFVGERAKHTHTHPRTQGEIIMNYANCNVEKNKSKTRFKNKQIERQIVGLLALLVYPIKSCQRVNKLLTKCYPSYMTICGVCGEAVAHFSPEKDAKKI